MGTLEEKENARKSDRLLWIDIRSRERCDGTRLFVRRNRGLLRKAETFEDARVRAVSFFGVFYRGYDFETKSRVYRQRGFMRVTRDTFETNGKPCARTDGIVCESRGTAV